MRATEVLKNEHQVIERVLQTLEKVTDRLEAGKTVSTEVLEDSLDFLSNFVDRRHHSKEEDALFPAMETAGGPEERGLVGEMLVEHEEGRGYLIALSKSVEDYRQHDAAATTALIESARGYTVLLSQHIRKEEQILFPIADRLLSEVAQNELMARFDRIDSEHLGTGVHERYHQMVETLLRKVRAATHPEA